MVLICDFLYNKINMYLDAEVIKTNSDGTVLLKADCNKSCSTCKGTIFCKQKDTTFSAKYSGGNLNKDNRVRVYLPPRQTIIATALLFCLPIIIMGAFLLLGQLKVLGEMLSAILAVLGLLLSYIILFVINRHSKDRNLPTIVEVYES